MLLLLLGTERRRKEKGKGEEEGRRKKGGRKGGRRRERGEEIGGLRRLKLISFSLADKMCDALSKHGSAIPSEILLEILLGLSLPPSCPSCHASSDDTQNWKLEAQVFDQIFEMALASLTKTDPAPTNSENSENSEDFGNSGKDGSGSREPLESVEHVIIEDFGTLPWAAVAFVLREVRQHRGKDEAGTEEKGERRGDRKGAPDGKKEQGGQSAPRGRRGPRGGDSVALKDTESQVPKSPNSETPKPQPRQTPKPRAPSRTKQTKTTTSFLIHSSDTRSKKFPPQTGKDADLFRLHLVQGMLVDSAKGKEGEGEGAEKFYSLFSDCLETLAASCSLDPLAPSAPSLPLVLPSGLPPVPSGFPSSLVEKYLLTSLHKTSVRARRAYSTLDFGEALAALQEFSESLQDLFFPLLSLLPPSPSLFHTNLVLYETLRRLASPLVPFLTSSLCSPPSPLPALAFLPTSEDHLTSSEKKQFLSLFKLRGFVASDKKRFTSRQNSDPPLQKIESPSESSENSSEISSDKEPKLRLAIELTDNNLCEDVELMKQLLPRLCCPCVVPGVPLEATLLSSAPTNTPNSLKQALPGLCKPSALENPGVTFVGGFVANFFGVAECSVVFKRDEEIGSKGTKGRKLNLRQAANFVWGRDN
jgi:hypothetical protein